MLQRQTKELIKGKGGKWREEAIDTGTTTSPPLSCVESLFKFISSHYVITLCVESQPASLLTTGQNINYAKVGIDVVHHLPGVGQNLQDHLG